MTLEQFQNNLALLHRGVIVCAAFAIVIFAVAVVLFFRFDILTIIKQRSNLVTRKSITKLHKENSKSGALKNERVARGELTQKPSLSKDLAKKAPMEQEVAVQAPVAYEITHTKVNDDPGTLVLGETSNSFITTKLSTEAAKPLPASNNLQTRESGHDLMPTTKLNTKQANKEESLENEVFLSAKEFAVSKSVLIVHANIKDVLADG